MKGLLYAGIVLLVLLFAGLVVIFQGWIVTHLWNWAVAYFEFSKPLPTELQTYVIVGLAISVLQGIFGGSSSSSKK